MRTIHLCAATTKGPTTLLAAIDRSIAELNRTQSQRSQFVAVTTDRPWFGRSGANVQRPATARPATLR
ncbi:MAG TPA: hypothetical protein VFY18_10880 [Candidatus Limnocylindrales bacterium]|nr:hypothetical protein [Candidatus Limnocylindrales bacterium]